MRLSRIDLAQGGSNYVDIVDEQDRATPEFETGVTIFFGLAKPVRVPQIGPARAP